MMRQHLPYYAIAAAILIVGLAAFGVPVSNLLFLGVILVCPLMMLFMMRGMHGGDSHEHGAQQPHADNEQQPYGHRH